MAISHQVGSSEARRRFRFPCNLNRRKTKSLFQRVLSTITKLSRLISVAVALLRRVRSTRRKKANVCAPATSLRDAFLQKWIRGTAGFGLGFADYTGWLINPSFRVKL
jgi:hypothetical protein